LNLKIILFIIAVVFIIGSLALALWYRMNDDKND
jgi:preprotein translocase subunit SecG